MDCNIEKNGITPDEFAEKYNLCENENFDDKLDVTSDEAHHIRTRRILALSERMLDKLSLAIDEISLCESKEKKRIKEVEYDKELNKPVCETHIETETSEIKNSLVDTASLKQLVSTLKDIKDIHLGLAKTDSNINEDESGVIVISDIEEKEAII